MGDPAEHPAPIHFDDIDRILARELVERIRVLTLDIDDLTNEITTMVADMAPTLLAIPGCGALTAAKILGETAGV